jgi:hypothetical protein
VYDAGRILLWLPVERRGDGLEYSLMREFALFDAICIPPRAKQRTELPALSGLIKTMFLNPADYSVH